MTADRNAVNPIGYAWRVAVIALAFFVATMVSGAIVTAAGMRFPELPGQTYSPALNLIGSLLLAACLAALARHIHGSRTARWLVLAVFTYVSFGVNNQIEALVFTTIGGTGPMLVLWLLPCLAGCGAAVMLIQPTIPSVPLTTVFTDRPVTAWWRRVVLAWLAFPVIYYVFGMLVSPLVIDTYRLGQFGLVLPEQRVVIAAVSLRSLLFLAGMVPILRTWSGSRRGLVVALGGALFVMVGAYGLVVATWLPATLRIAHGLEILADSAVYVWVLVALLVPWATSRKPVVSGATRR
jgi:hypothetical protein